MFCSLSAIGASAQFELIRTVSAQQPLGRGVEEPGCAEEERSVLVDEEGVEGVEDGRADGLLVSAAVVLEEVVEDEAQLRICRSNKQFNISKGVGHTSTYTALEVDRVCQKVINGPV